MQKLLQPFRTYTFNILSLNMIEGFCYMFSNSLWTPLCLVNIGKVLV